MNISKVDIVFSGVGGQGILLLSEIVSLYYMKLGYDVKKSEIHGMSQRGGSVYSNVRANKDRVYSPYIGLGAADLVVSLEILEAVRFSKYLHKNGIIITSSLTIPPSPVMIGKEKYPDIEKLLSFFREIGWRYYVVDTPAIAKRIGNNRVHNIAILGTMCKVFNMNKAILEEIIREKIKPKYVDKNILAFYEGYNAVSG